MYLSIHRLDIAPVVVVVVIVVGGEARRRRGFQIRIHHVSRFGQGERAVLPYQK